jgi:hypothetical protein
MSAERYIADRVDRRTATRLEWRALYAFRRARRPNGRRSDLVYAYSIIRTSNELHAAAAYGAMRAIARGAMPMLEAMRRLADAFAVNARAAREARQ